EKVPALPGRTVGLVPGCETRGPGRPPGGSRPQAAGGRTGRSAVRAVSAPSRGRDDGPVAARAGLLQPGRGVVGSAAGRGVVHVRAAPGGRADQQCPGATATGSGPGAQGGAGQQDGGGGTAPQRDRECAGIAACQPGGVHAVRGAAGSAALAGRGPKPVPAPVAGLAGSNGGGARHGIATDGRDAPTSLSHSCAPRRLPFYAAHRLPPCRLRIGAYRASTTISQNVINASSCRPVNRCACFV